MINKRAVWAIEGGLWMLLNGADAFPLIGY
jgi:hypothetical protein